MKILILASGFGTRLYPLNEYRAKGLIEYKGKELITYIVNKVPQGMDILVNINKKFEADFRKWQNAIDRRVTLCVEPVFNEKQIFGAVGSLHYWIKTKNIADDLLVIGSDNYFEFDLVRFIAAYNSKDALVAIYDVGDRTQAKQFGVAQLDGNKIIAFEEKPTEPKTSLVATAIYIFPQRIFPLVSQYCAEGKRDNLGGFITYLIGRVEVYAYKFSELWFDIGDIDVYKAVQQNSSFKP